jgi:hypothetical protein
MVDVTFDRKALSNQRPIAPDGRIPSALTDNQYSAPHIGLARSDGREIDHS